MKSLLVLRPEPGNSATATRARAMGLEIVQCPLFAVEPVAWSAPDAGRFDALLLTSANALRHGGSELAKLRQLDGVAVGETTAAAARDAGFRIADVGTSGVEALLERLPGEQRLLHLTGADHHRATSRHAIETIVAYRSVALPARSLPTGPCVALVHSARAGSRLAELVTDRSTIAIAAISPAAASACGGGWDALEAAGQPCEAALLALAARLCQD